MKKLIEMFKFKINRPTGRYRSFFNTNIQIMLKGGQKQKIVGFCEIHPYNIFSIYFQVLKEDIMEDGNKNCVWKNKFYCKKKFDSINDFKKWLNENFETIKKEYNLYES